MVKKKFGSKTILGPKSFESKEIWSLKKFWFKKRWLKTELSFKKIAQIFLIKTNFGQILGPKMLGPKNESERIWKKKSEKNYLVQKNWMRKKIESKGFLGPTHLSLKFG